MNYLPDAALFLFLTLCLVVGGWCYTPRAQSSFEAAIVPGAAILGVAAWLIWIVGSVWSLVPLFWCALPWPILLFTVISKRENLAFHARRTLQGLRCLRGLDLALALYLAGLFALAFLLSLAPPNGADYDSLTYHLAVPAQYLRAGKVIELPFDHHSYFPFTLEMLYAIGLWARGAVFAKLFHWLMLPIGALALCAIGKRAGSARGGLLAACLYASTPLLLQEATTAYIDLGFAAFAFLAVLCFERARETYNQNDWALSGAFCGMCLGTKYFGALIFGFLGIALLFWMRTSRPEMETATKNEAPRPKPARIVSFFVVPALILGGLWYARNVFWTGNPVFPFAYSLFGGRGWTASMARDYNVSQSIYGFGKTPLDLIWLPFRLALSPLNFGQPFWPLAGTPPEKGLTGAFEVQGLLLSSLPGPALFALGIPALFARHKPRPIALAGAFFGFLLTFWFFTSQQIRYLIPSLGFLALLGGWGAVHFAPRLRIAGKIGAVFLACWFVFAPLWLLHNNRSNWGVLSGAQTPTAYLSRAFSGFDAMNYANQNLSPDAKIAVFGEPRCFYLNRAYFWADDAHNDLIDYAALRNGADFARALKKLGATHVLWNTKWKENGGVFDAPQPLMDNAIAAGNLTLITDLRGYRIYRIAD